MKKPYRKYSNKRDLMLFELGEQFITLGRKGFERKGDVNFEPQIFASIVNIAFSAELFLKYLLELRKRNFKRKHELKLLFNSLDENDKKVITDSMFFNLAVFKSNEKYKEYGFEKLLEAHSTAFYNFRYLHEELNFKEAFSSGLFDFDFLINFATILHNHIKNIKLNQ